MARRRYSTSLQGFSEINVTPLMDLVFLLLVVFMITAPTLEYRVDVSPPKMTASRINEPKSVMVNLTAKGKILYERDEISAAELTTRLRAVKTKKPETAALIRADGGRPYREVIDVMKAVRLAGFDNVSLVTQSDDDKK
ncbi:MAG: hypothetical protein A3K19_28145 [Lentisphaerae bacterium RIFOXYB12_FULL_65_16]|nr:MAG: hypothetical protein A3K18_34295 [Lentisphaerae bacterium RIFOXYA12_64_32]OGV85463.1 MAG: hypothetical protein A3K19_28145 [Lentisphaerae bacterium RIFOXYB12_FULL_65_16]